MERWKNFFQTYRLIEIKNDQDLLYQVGATVNGKPISHLQHQEIINSIVDGLELNQLDNILDLCCGNGVIAFDISKKVNKIIGIDGSEPYIDNAKKYKSGNNIKYFYDDIKNFPEYTSGENINKVILYASLAYLSKGEFDALLNKLNRQNIQRIFIGSILNKKKKFVFFNTTRRRLHYLLNYIILHNDMGLGNWWSKNEINKIAEKNGYKVIFKEQNSILHTAHYRFDAIITYT